jgi:hypothetical protein
MNSNDKPQMGLIKGWAVLLSVCCFVYLFAAKIGPWLLPHIWGLEKIAEVVEEQNIDAGAYYYTEIEGAPGYRSLSAHSLFRHEVASPLSGNGCRS